jgi:hypothetical protein
MDHDEQERETDGGKKPSPTIGGGTPAASDRPLSGEHDRE